MRILKKQNSFIIALICSVSFFLVYFILAKLGLIVTLEPNLSVGDVSRWCERVSSSIYREPINAFSNVGFMITGLIMFWILSKLMTARILRDKLRVLKTLNFPEKLKM